MIRQGNYAKNFFLLRPFAVGRVSGPFLPLLLTTVSILPLLSVETPAAEVQQAAVSKPPCYAFLRDGDIWAVCEGKRERIDIHARALDFAVSGDGAYFAVQENLEPSGIGRTRQLLVALNPTLKEVSRQVDYPELLYATCGTIVSFEFVNRHGFDLIKSRPMEPFPPYKYFRCSSDRRVTAGITEEDETKWYNRPRSSPTYWTEGFPLKVRRSGKESEFSVENRDAFDVSPNGDYLVFVRAPKQGADLGLCIAGPQGEPSCVDHYVDAVSVSDNGEVLLWAGELGLMYWRPGLKRPLLLEKAPTNSPSG